MLTSFLTTFVIRDSENKTTSSIQKNTYIAFLYQSFGKDFHQVQKSEALKAHNE
jgi:hypothetical protein